MRPDNLKWVQYAFQLNCVGFEHFYKVGQILQDNPYYNYKNSKYQNQIIMSLMNNKNKFIIHLYYS